jgi:transposase
MVVVTTIGLDLAKNDFQVHAVDVAGSVVLRKRLRRGQVLAFFAGLPPCLIGLEACATAHHWARELIALGHETRLVPPSHVKAYVKRNSTTTLATSMTWPIPRRSVRRLGVRRCASYR